MKTLYWCVKGCEFEPDVWYRSEQECRDDCGDPNADIIKIYITVEYG